MQKESPKVRKCEGIKERNMRNGRKKKKTEKKVSRIQCDKTETKRVKLSRGLEWGFSEPLSSVFQLLNSSLTKSIPT